MVHAVVVTFNQTVLQEGNKICYISSNYHISATIPSLYDGHHPTASFDMLLNQYVTIISGVFFTALTSAPTIIGECTFGRCHPSVDILL